MAAIEETEKLRNIQAWAEARADLEIEMGLPKMKRDERITELIAQRHAELAKKPLETELDPGIIETAKNDGHPLPKVHRSNRSPGDRAHPR